MHISFRLRPIATLLITGLLYLLPVPCESRSGQRVQEGFKYPPSQETIQVDAEIKSRSLSGNVTDPSGGGTSKVLVERVRPGWGRRISAVLTDSYGHFAFAGTTRGAHFLRVSKPGFNTMLIKVRVNRKVRSRLRIELKLSH